MPSWSLDKPTVYVTVLVTGGSLGILSMVVALVGVESQPIEALAA